MSMKARLVLGAFMILIVVTLVAAMMKLKVTAQEVTDGKAAKRDYCLGVVSILGDLKARARKQNIEPAYGGALHMVRYCLNTDEIEDQLAWAVVDGDPKAIQDALGALQDRVYAAVE